MQIHLSPHSFCIYSLKSFCKEDLSFPLIYLSIQSCIYVRLDSWILILFFGLWYNTIIIYFIELFQVWSLEVTSGWSCVLFDLLTCSRPFLKHFSTFWHKEMLQPASLWPRPSHALGGQVPYTEHWDLSVNSVCLFKCPKLNPLYF